MTTQTRPRFGTTRHRVATQAALVLLLPLLAVACTTIGSTLSERDPSELGPYPKDYDQIVRRWIEDTVPSITSIETLVISSPQSGFADSLFTRRRYGWWTHVTFRARDRIGLPKGKMVYALLIHDGEVVAKQKRLN